MFQDLQRGYNSKSFVFCQPFVARKFWLRSGLIQHSWLMRMQCLQLPSPTSVSWGTSKALWHHKLCSASRVVHGIVKIRGFVLKIYHFLIDNHYLCLIEEDYIFISVWLFFCLLDYSKNYEWILTKQFRMATGLMMVHYPDAGFFKRLLMADCNESVLFATWSSSLNKEFCHLWFLWSIM